MWMDDFILEMDSWILNDGKAAPNEIESNTNAVKRVPRGEFREASAVRLGDREVRAWGCREAKGAARRVILFLKTESWEIK